MQENKKSSKILWRCHRGMLELDLILIPFYEKFYANLSNELREEFVELLSLPDPVIYDYLVTKASVDDTRVQSIVEYISKSL